MNTEEQESGGTGASSEPRVSCAVLGYGTMGRLIAQLLVDRGAGPVVVANRSSDRVAGVLPEGVSVASRFPEAVASASIVFLCVKPQACAEVVRQVSATAGRQTLLVSVAGDVVLGLLESLWPGTVVRMMPTVTAAVGLGVNLLCGSPGDTARVRGVFPLGLGFLEVSENRWNATSAVTSCGPGLVSALMKTWCDDLAARTGLTSTDAEALVVETVAATLGLRKRGNRDFRDILGAVASPGGVTGEGARILGERMPGLWSEVTEAMDQRHRKREAEVRNGISGKNL